MVIPSKRPKAIFFSTVRIILILFTGILLVQCSFKKTGRSDEKPILQDSLAEKPPVTLTFGIPSDSFNIIKGHIRPSRFLSEILGEYGVSLQEIDQVVKHSKNVFDVKDLRAGSNYTVFTDKDSMAKLRYFIYEHDPTVFYVFSFNDSLNITPIRNKIISELKFSSGRIETSLWDALINGGMNAELAFDLSDIFAWTVDFFGLQKGDGFRVLYEERYIGGKSIGVGKVYAAEFLFSGKKIYAIPMIQKGVESYFDSDGNSLRKAFLKAPLRYSRISSGFSSARMHPILRIVRPHFGVDYAAPIGTPVYSIGDGKVISATIEGESGRIVRIRHNSVYTTAYLHLSSFAKGIYGGAMVKQGDVIGYVGSSGLSTGAHLDFRFYKNGSAVDPLRVEAPSVEPVLEENIEKFEKIKRVIIGLLGSSDQTGSELITSSIMGGK